jgi:transposase, IS5 family
MLGDKYGQGKFFVKIEHLASEMDPELAVIDEVLNDEGPFQQVKAALMMGRPSTSVEVILRMLVIKHLYNLSYEQTERQVKDSLVLRQFCRVYFEEAPDDTTLIRWAGLIEAATLETLNRQVLALARCRKLRTDGMVVETNIHYPTDNIACYTMGCGC